MRTIEHTVYTFDELSEDAKSAAREWVRTSDFEIFGFSEDWENSIRTFVDHFGANLKDWRIGPWCPVDYTVNFENSHFRGLKLKQFSPDYMPTGFCADYDLWHTFHEVFKRTGDAKQAFKESVDAGFIGWRNDWEAAHADDNVDDFLTANDYEFYEDGRKF